MGHKGVFGGGVRVQPALALGEDVGVEVDEAGYCSMETG